MCGGEDWDEGAGLTTALDREPQPVTSLPPRPETPFPVDATQRGCRAKPAVLKQYVVGRWGIVPYVQEREVKQVRHLEHISVRKPGHRYPHTSDFLLAKLSTGPLFYRNDTWTFKIYSVLVQR